MVEAYETVQLVCKSAEIYLLALSGVLGRSAGWQVVVSWIRDLEIPSSNGQYIFPLHIGIGRDISESTSMFEVLDL